MDKAAGSFEDTFGKRIVLQEQATESILNHCLQLV